MTSAAQKRCHYDPEPGGCPRTPTRRYGRRAWIRFHGIEGLVDVVDETCSFSVLTCDLLKVHEEVTEFADLAA